MKHVKLKSDKYKKARGGNSRILKISCSNCKTNIFSYQKDGIGTLKRVYIDRIISEQSIIPANNLVCPNCKKVLGTPMIYKKENRPALRLILGAITKKVIFSV
ncbi:MAG: hypothetical protein QMD92_04405 [bacterium]|nr:hypothetical protein [bacterium]